jgi:hypothetical protein
MSGVVEKIRARIGPVAAHTTGCECPIAVLHKGGECGNKARVSSAFHVMRALGHAEIALCRACRNHQ